MKKMRMIVLIGCLFVAPAFAQAQVDRMIDQFLDRGGHGWEGRIGPNDLSVSQLEFSPDPIREGQPVTFRAKISNHSDHSGRVTLTIKDKDEIISEMPDVFLRPGDNQVVFPERSYRFSRSDHCFTVEADIERTRSPIDATREFCARPMGWTLGFN